MMRTLMLLKNMLPSLERWEIWLEKQKTLSFNPGDDDSLDE